VTSERIPAHEQRLILTHRIPPRWSLFRNRLVRKPSRLTLGVAAAIVATAAGVAAAVSAGSAPAGPAAAGAAGNPEAIGRAIASGEAGHSGAPGSAAGSGRSSSSGAAGHAAPARPAKPYLFYDSVTPSAIPSGHVIATYSTGPYAVSPAQVAGRPVLWIDTNGTDPAAAILDVEPGDATPSQAASWASQKLSAHPDALARIYTAIGEWSATQAAIATLPAKMRAHVRWWIADPTGYPHIVPGSDATQWYWGSSYDISTATPRF
jgi:hypothetical protein